MFLLVSVVAIFIAVQWCVINPALEQLPNGNYGELYGPVRVLRWPFYLIIFAGALVALRRFFSVRKLER
jgi:hypothetical protein